jgi:hypothetical protein
MSRAEEFYFTRPQNTLIALTSELNTRALQMTFKKAVIHIQNDFFSDFEVRITTPAVHSSKPEQANSYVFHYEFFTQLIFLGSVLAEEAWSSTNSNVPTVHELACKSSQRVLWPRKVELFSPRHDLTFGLNNF